MYLRGGGVGGNAQGYQNPWNLKHRFEFCITVGTEKAAIKKTTIARQHPEREGTGKTFPEADLNT